MVADALDVEAMLDMIIRLHVEGVLSEGQAARCTGLSRIEIRRRADLRQIETLPPLLHPSLPAPSRPR